MMQSLSLFTNPLPPQAAPAQGGWLWLAPPPPKARGWVLICPGGGYQWLSPREAQPVAQAFIRKGWAAAVLYYATRPSPDLPPLGAAPLHQLGEAVRCLRERQPGLPVAVCGFSAGGHLTASLGAHWKELGLPRPDALVLAYPVITAGPHTHPATLQNLVGEQGGQRDFFSLEQHVTRDFPQTFLWHTVTDADVPVQNSLLLADALSRAGVRYEMHLYPTGVHGLSLATPEVEEPEKDRFADAHIAGWFELCCAFLQDAVRRDD